MLPASTVLQLERHLKNTRGKSSTAARKSGSVFFVSLKVNNISSPPELYCLLTFSVMTDPCKPWFEGPRQG